ACGESGKDLRIHYQAEDRDFLVNMAGCEWGRDCWGEMYKYRELSYTLNKGHWETFIDWVRNSWKPNKVAKATDSTKDGEITLPAGKGDATEKGKDGAIK